MLLSDIDQEETVIDSKYAHAQIEKSIAKIRSITGTTWMEINL